MKKERKQLWIDKKIWFKIDSLLKTIPKHPLTNYRSITEFTEKTLNMKIDEIQNLLILEKIKEAGLDSVIGDAKELQQIKRQAEATGRRLTKAVDKILGKKHTHRVYKSKKK